MIVYGRNVAKEILRNNKKIEKIVLQENFDDKEILSLIENQKIDVQRMTKREFSKFDKYSHQGIILYIEDFKYYDVEDFLENDSSFVIILDHLEDPHNLGAIIRTCESAGVDGIIIPKDRSVEVNSTVMKTSAGALENVKIAKVVNLKQTIDKLKKNGYWVVGTDLEDSVDYREIDYGGKICLVIGSEGFGMTKSIKDSCDFIARIPMYGKVNSLNASVAAGIMIYEVIRSKKIGGLMYKDTNDFELLYLISENDEEAYNKIFYKYSNMARIVAKKYYRRCKYLGVSFDDIYQAGLYGLGLAIDNFTEHTGTLFYTCANTFITREIQAFIRNNARKKHNVLSDSIPIDREIDEDGNTLECFLSSNSNSINAYYDEQQALKLLNFKYELPFLHSLIYELRINNFSNKEISILLNIKYKDVDNALTSIKNKLKKKECN